MVVNNFFSSMRQDYYPLEEFEKVFGVEMTQGYTPTVCDFPIGKLMFNVWLTLWKNNCINEDNLTQALWNHNLPQFFENQVRRIYNEYIERSEQPEPVFMYMTQYVPELLSRGFDGIPWDLEAHQLLKKASLHASDRLQQQLEFLSLSKSFPSLEKKLNMMDDISLSE